MIRYYLSRIWGVVNPQCPRQGSGCSTTEGDTYGRMPCTDTRGWIDGERCAYYSRTGILERIFSRIARGLEAMEGIKED